MSAKEKNVRKNSDGRVFTIVRGGESVNTAAETAEDSENAWVFESLVGFLTGPIWNSTMMTFLEHKSIVFDSTEDNQDEYRQIHEEYRNLVDLMLNSFTQDLGINAEQFEKACSQANGDIVTSQLQRTLFDQIWAAEDYTVFVHMMIQKNTELQLQALEFLKKRGVSFDADADVPPLNDNQTEPDSELNEVLRRSVEEHEKTLSDMSQEEKEEVEKLLSASMDEERRRLAAENESERQTLEKAIKLSLEEADEPVITAERANSSSKSNSLDERFEKIHKKTTEQEKKIKQDGISDEEVAKRQAYLRQQRDKLLALKQQKRIRQLDEQPSSDPSRPRSSKMARSVIQSGDGTDTAAGAGHTPIDPGILAARRALVTRLKAEVIGKK